MVDDIVSLFYYGLKEAVSSSNLIHSLVKTVKFLNLAVKVKEKIKTNFPQESAQYLGLPVTDINGYSDIGFMQSQTTTKDGRRFRCQFYQHFGSSFYALRSQRLTA